MTAEDDAADADGRSSQSQPADPVQPFTQKDGSGDGEQDRHGAHHERCVADRGQSKSVELEQKLDGDAEHRGKQKDASLDASPGPAIAAEKCSG